MKGNCDEETEKHYLSVCFYKFKADLADILSKTGSDETVD